MKTISFFDVINILGIINHRFCNCCFQALEWLSKKIKKIQFFAVEFLQNEKTCLLTKILPTLTLTEKVLEFTFSIEIVIQRIALLQTVLNNVNITKTISIVYNFFLSCCGLASFERHFLFVNILTTVFCGRVVHQIFSVDHSC